MDGINQDWSTPYCAYACRALISSANLTCTIPAGPGMDDAGHSHGAATAVTTANCRATDPSFLTTLAYCIKSRCASIEPEVESYWFNQVTGDSKAPPMWTHRTALNNIRDTPNSTWQLGRTINETMLVLQAAYNIQVNGLEIKEHNSNNIYKYS